MASTAPEIQGRATPASIAAERKPAVLTWAGAGAAALVLEAWILGRWITGPGLETVPAGPTAVPGWMKVCLIVGEVACPLAMLFCLYRFVVVPWRRERRWTTEGLFCLAFLLTSPYDVTSNYFQHWFTYNAYLVNFGSILSSLPGTMSPNSPGHTSAWPVLIAPPVYVFMFVGLMIFGSWVMRRVRERWPAIGNFALVLTCFTVMALAEFVIEGLLFIRLGFWTVPGGAPAINPTHYYRYPVSQVVFAGAFFTALSCLYHFRNDAGETLPERGLSRLRASAPLKTSVRFLAILAAFQLCMGVFYHLPTAVYVVDAKASWPTDLQKRSYLTDHVCGPGTDYACPAPNVPLPRGNSSPHLDPAGRLVTR
jgi:Spirocyclase AveC-like